MHDDDVLKKELKNEVEYLLACGDAAWVVANKVIEILHEHDAKRINILELFSKDVVQEKILDPGEIMIKSGINGQKVKTISVYSNTGAQENDQSYLIPMYEKVFREWEEMGWISISIDDDDNSLAVRVRIKEK